MTLGSVCHVSTITIFKELFNLNVTILSTGAEQNLCLKKVHVHVLTPVSALYMYVTQQKLELLKEHVTNQNTIQLMRLVTHPILAKQIYY